MDEGPPTPSQLAQRLAGFGTWRWEVATDTVVWSRELYRIYGRDPDRFVPTLESFLACIDLRDRERIRQGIVDAVTSGTEFEHEERIVRGDGQIRLLRSSGRVERDADGRPVRVTGACLDITEQRAAQVALAEREAELRLALAAARMGTFTWWMASRRVVCSAEVERLVGVPLAVADDLRAVMSDDDWQAVSAEADRALRDPRGHMNLRFRVERADGQRWLQATGTIERGDEGPVVKGTLADVTEQALLEAQFLRAQKMESVGRLAGGVAHDFNNLLTVILAEAGLLEGEPGLGDAVLEGLSAISGAATRAADLTRQLLMIARAQPLQLDRVDLVACVERAAALYRRVLGELIELDVELPSKPAPVVMARVQLEQLLLNLVTNAGEAMPRGGRLRIRLLDRPAATAHDAPRHPVEAHAHVVIEVTDSGRGVSAAIADKIFDPFFSTKPQGTGLGLSTCYGIVHRYGGVIEHLPAAGGGATFRVVLPRARLPAEAATAPTPMVRGGCESVLLVEDDPQVRRLAERILRQQGYRVRAAQDGQAALAALHGSASERPFDILVTDVVMPNLGGVPLARALQARWPGLPVLFMSGYTADAFADGIPEGSTLLRKPFLPSALAQQVRALLDAG